jgi:hypothetical protein
MTGNQGHLHLKPDGSVDEIAGAGPVSPASEDAVDGADRVKNGACDRRFNCSREGKSFSRGAQTLGPVDGRLECPELDPKQSVATVRFTATSYNERLSTAQLAHTQKAG